MDSSPPQNAGSIPSADAKRPWPHRWVMVLFGFVGGVFIIHLIYRMVGNPLGTLWNQPFLATLFGLSGFAFVLLTTMKHHRFTYFVTSGTLAVWSFRGTMNSFNVLVYYFKNRSTAEYLQHPLPQAFHITLTFAALLLLWLLISFSFGSASKRFFAFQVQEKIPPSPRPC
jgi:hypothetical protein